MRRFMSELATAGTGPELALRRELQRRGLRYRVNVRTLPGSPDIALTRAMIAVFVDGCFWHSCPEHAVAPKANAEWWRTKLDANIARDRRDETRLWNSGWLVVRVWEHQEPAPMAEVIERLWRERIEVRRRG